LLIALTVIVVVAAPYLLIVIHNHSLAVFTQSFLGQHSQNVLIKQLSSVFSLKYLANIDIFWVFGLLGLITLIRTQNWIIPFWFLSLSSIPSESAWLISASGALLIGYAGFLLIEYVINPLKNKEGRKRLSSWVLIAFCLLFLIIKAKLVYEDFYSYYEKEKNSLPSVANMKTLEWINQNTPKNAKVVVIVTKKGIIEWAPPITERTILNVPQGTEFDIQKRAVILHFNDTVMRCKDITCISNSTRYAFSTDSYYLLISDNFLESIEMDSSSQSVVNIYNQNDLNFFFINGKQFCVK